MHFSEKGNFFFFFSTSVELGRVSGIMSPETVYRLSVLLLPFQIYLYFFTPYFKWAFFFVFLIQSGQRTSVVSQCKPNFFLSVLHTISLPNQLGIWHSLLSAVKSNLLYSISNFCSIYTKHFLQCIHIYVKTEILPYLRKLFSSDTWFLKTRFYFVFLSKIWKRDLTSSKLVWLNGL